MLLLAIDAHCLRRIIKQRQDGLRKIKLVFAKIGVFVASLDDDVDALGRVMTGRETVVFIEETQEIGEGFDLAAIAS